MRKYDFGLQSIPLTPQTLHEHDCTLIVTDHSAVDYDFVMGESPLVVDTRNATAKVARHREKIVRC
jgi:UDP-N-acetyl-D-glucosamine dehydrogenase